MTILSKTRYQHFYEELHHQPTVALQLYSLRRELEKDFIGTLETLVSLGIQQVETYPLPESIELESARRIFQSMGLSVIGMHVDYPMGRTSIEEVLRMSDAFRCSTVIYSGWPEAGKYESETLLHTIEHFDAASQLLESYGMEFVLHNHWYEFEPHGTIVPFPYLLKTLSPRVLFEIDVYWVQTGGADPSVIVKDFGERVVLLHVKDGAATKEKMYEQTSIGKGTLDFYSIFSSLPRSVRAAIIEFDEYDGSVFDGIQESYHYLISNSFVKGRIKR
ncbi:MAG: TIM barrel protein [Bacteroidetes bacterium]|nr:TIM barrel protein [Bacteroidota bacterium]